MPRWLEILLTLVLFTALMGVASVIGSATVPAVDAWLVAHIGNAGIWLGLIALWITGGVLLYREKTGRAGKAAGR